MCLTGCWMWRDAPLPGGGRCCPGCSRWKESLPAAARSLPATRSLFSRTLLELEPARSSAESRVLKFHTIRVWTSSTVRAAIRAERERRASLRAHGPPTIFNTAGSWRSRRSRRSWRSPAQLDDGGEWMWREAEEAEEVVEEEEEGGWALWWRRRGGDRGPPCGESPQEEVQALQGGEAPPREKNFNLSHEESLG